MTRALLRRLGDDRRGNTIIEFAIIAPTMMMLLMGLGDLLYQPYIQSILDGAMQKAGRDSAIQGGAQKVDDLDSSVIAMVRRVAKNVTYVSSRKNYYSFSSMKPENFVDANKNNKYDLGECFDDINANSTWDKDPSRSGQGGANDVTLYTMTITYPRLFPVAKLLGFTPEQTLVAKTLLKNQPYASQTVVTPVKVGGC